MTEDVHPLALMESAIALGMLLNRLEKKEAAERVHWAIVTLNRAVPKTPDSSFVGVLAIGMAAVTQHLEPQEAAATFPPNPA